MSVVTENAKAVKVLDDSFEANESLASSEGIAVALVAGASGRAKVGKPSGQGVLCAGILLNNPASGEMAQVRELGVAGVKANAAFNSGIELAVVGTSGKLAAASSGDYVVAIAREASLGADHIISALVVGPYQKN